MKIILKYIFKNLQERKLRTIVMLFSIILSTALFFAALTVGDCYTNAQIKMAKGLAGKASISVTAVAKEDGKLAFVNENIIPNKKEIANKVGIVQTSALFEKENEFDNFDLISAELSKLNTINKSRIIKEHGFNNFTGKKIVLPEKFASKYNIKLDDQVNFKIMGKNYNFTVVAVAANDTVFLRQQRGYTALLPKETLEKILNVNNEYSSILVETSENVNVSAFASKLSKELKGEYKVQPVVMEQQLKKDARSKSMPFFLISFFALVMSVFIIYSSYKVITIERLSIIGTFRSVGAAENMVKMILIMESIIYGIVGGVFGIFLGLKLAGLIFNQLSSGMMSGLEMKVVASKVNVMLTFISAVVVSMLSAYLPVKRVSNLPLKDVVLGAVDVKNVSNKFKLTSGIVMFIIAVVLPYTADERFLKIAGGTSLLILLISSLILIPLLTAALSTVFEKIYEVFFGNEGKLAARNLKWNKNINQNICLLVISISSVIVIMLVDNCVKTYLGDVFKGCKLDGYTDSQNINKEFVEKIQRINGVKNVLPEYVFSNVIVNDKNVNRVEGVKNLKLYNEMLALKYDNNIQNSFENGRNILVKYDLAKELKIKVGDSVCIKTNNGIKKYKVTGEYTSRASGASCIIPEEYAKEDFNPKVYGAVFYQCSNPDTVTKEIRNLYNGRDNFTRSIKEFNLDSSGVIKAFLEPMNKLTYFIVILGAVGIINNLIINYIQKKRSIAMYKSVGMSKVQNIKMTLIEGFTSGIIGAIIGSGIAYLEARIIFKVAGPSMGGLAMNMPVSMFIIASVIGILINLIGSIVPIIKGSRLQIVEEIRFQ